MELTDDEYYSKEDLPNEIWKDITGYEGLYQVSNLGRVKALERTILCSNQTSKKFNHIYPEKIIYRNMLHKPSNYYQINLSKDGKRKIFLLHRLVAQEFVENPNNYPEINHKDRNKLNNSADNLEWCTKLQNMQDAIDKGWNPRLSRLGATNGEYWRQRISEVKSKKCRCIETGEEFSSYTEAEKAYNLYKGAVYKSIHDHVSNYGKYTFESID